MISVREQYAVLSIPSEVTVELNGRVYSLHEKVRGLNDLLMATVGDYVVDTIFSDDQNSYYITVKTVPVKKNDVAEA